MNTEETKNRVIVAVTVTLCAFLLFSLIGTFVLEWAGRESSGIWSRIFDLVNVLAGALVGYVAGQQVEKVRIGKDLSPDRYVEPMPPHMGESEEDQR